jgi:hypothetical protein
MQKLSRAPRGTIIPNGSERTPIRLINGARTSFVDIVGRATVQISVAAATAILNRGSVFALADEIVIDENGTDRCLANGKALRFASEMAAPSALTAKRVTSTAVGTYQLEEMIRVYFAHPLALDPLETAFVERDARQALNVQVRTNATPAAQLLTAGPATVAVTNIKWNVIQAYEKPGPNGLRAPLYIPSIRQQTAQVNGAVTAQVEYIKTTNLIRAMIVSQEVAGVEVSDIINSLAFKGDFRDIIGPSPMDYNDICLDSEFEFGGAVISSNRAHIGFNFQRYGRLSDCLNPAQDVNLRMELNAQPSATAGQSIVRTTIFELVRDAQVTAPVIPFPV